MYPPCLRLVGVEKVGEYAITSGQYGDIWKGLVQGHTVAIKVLKIYETADIEKLLKVREQTVLATRRDLTLHIGLFFRNNHLAADIPFEYITVVWNILLGSKPIKNMSSVTVDG
jgi:hypothetical protein